MTEASFQLTYDGPELADGSMPVSELAPALLALGDLVNEASRVSYPDRDPVSLTIRATNEGSFLVELAMYAQEHWDEVSDLFTDQTTTALANLTTIVVGAGGLFELIRRAGTKLLAKKERGLEPGTTRLIFSDELTIEVPDGTALLFESPRAREAAYGVVRPLEHKGIEVARLTTAEGASVSVSATDVPSFYPPGVSPEEDLLDQEEDRWLTVERPVFDEKPANWRFSAGDGSSFGADVADEAFLERVRSGGLAFRAGTQIFCRVRIRQYRSPSGRLQLSRTILRVLEHQPAPETGLQTLDLEGPSDPSGLNPED